MQVVLNLQILFTFFWITLTYRFHKCISTMSGFHLLPLTRREPGSYCCFFCSHRLSLVILCELLARYVPVVLLHSATRTSLFLRSDVLCCIVFLLCFATGKFERLLQRGCEVGEASVGLPYAQKCFHLILECDFSRM